MSIEQDYQKRVNTRSDINELMPVIREYASKCNVVAEFGVRSGNSTCAILAGLQDGGGLELHSYDKNKAGCSFDTVKWKFTQADTSTLEGIPYCEMLFIDTLHTAKQVEAELKHAASVSGWILFHDTMLFGDKGEGRDGGYGITHAIYDFLAKEHKNWRVKEHYPHNNGLLVLQRL